MPTSSQRAPPVPHKSRATERKQIGEGCTNTKRISILGENEHQNLKRPNSLRPSSQQANRLKPEENQNLCRKTKSNNDFKKPIRFQSNKSDKFEKQTGTPSQKSNRSQIGENCKSEIRASRPISSKSILRNEKEERSVRPLSQKANRSECKQKFQSNCRSQIPVRSANLSLNVVQVEQKTLLLEKSDCNIKTSSCQKISQNQIEQKKSKTPIRPLSQKSNRNQLKQENSKPKENTEIVARPLSACSNRCQFKREKSNERARPLSASSNRSQFKREESNERTTTSARSLSQRSNRIQENQSVGKPNSKTKSLVKSSNQNQLEQKVISHEKPIKAASRKSVRIETEQEIALLDHSISLSCDLNSLSDTFNSRTETSINRIQVEREVRLSEKSNSNQIKDQARMCRRPISPCFQKPLKTPIKSVQKVNRIQVERRILLPRRSNIRTEAPGRSAASQTQLCREAQQEIQLCRRPISPSCKKPSQSQLNDSIRRPVTPSSQKFNQIQVNRGISLCRKSDCAMETPTIKSPLQNVNRVKQKTAPCKKPGTPVRPSSPRLKQEIVLPGKSDCKTEILNKLPLRKLDEIQIEQEIQFKSDTLSQKSNCIEIEQEIVLTEKSNTSSKPLLQNLDKIQKEKETQSCEISIDKVETSSRPSSQKSARSDSSSRKTNKTQIDQEIQLPAKSFCKSETPAVKFPFQKLNCPNFDINPTLIPNQLDQNAFVPKKSEFKFLLEKPNPYIMQNQRPLSQQYARTQVVDKVISKMPSAIDFECREDRINKKSTEARNSLKTYTSLIKELETMVEDKDISNASLSRYSTESTTCSGEDKTVPVAVPKSRCNNENQDGVCKKKDEKTETPKKVCMYMGDIKDEIRPSVGTSIECYNLSSINYLGDQGGFGNKTLHVSSVKKDCNNKTCTELIKDKSNNCTESSIYLQTTLPSISNNISEIMKELEKNLNQQKSSISKLGNFEDESLESCSKHNRKRSYFSECTKLDSGIRKHSRNYRNIKRTCQQSLASSLLRMSRETNCRKLIETTKLSKLKKHLHNCDCVVCRCSPSLIESSSSTTTEDIFGDCECMVCRSVDSYGKLKVQDKNTKREKKEKDKLERKKAKTEIHTNDNKTIPKQLFNNLPPELLATNYRDDTNFDYMLPQRLCRFEYRYGRPVGNTTSFNRKDISDLLSPSVSVMNGRNGKKHTCKTPSNPFGKRIRTNSNFDRESPRIPSSFDLRQDILDDRLLHVRYPPENRDTSLLRFDLLFDTVREIFTLGRTIIHTLIRYN
ncbi:hypothetical protein ILUMI_06911 [Ignelater luminosus]|uniref:Uncharacterized protein n=1 Tax=Ignelater luminosus TaxID=2038154 RepID=A0A8K0GIK2_IGNLU|nr:hypothetical protein ILUMI_06911 [Ignelater luminosus]